MKEHTVITISRQYGSGGREIAEILAKKMQVRCYDRQIVYLAAEKIGNGDLDVESILGEAYRLPGTQRGLWGNFSFGSNVIPDYNQMYKEQAMLIKKLAEKSGGVFLGRCADAILSDRPNCYHIFVYADDLFREQRSGKEYGNLSLAEMDKEDKARQRYYNYYTGRTWGNPLNYDLMLNTSKIGIHEAAEVILDYIEKVQK